MRDLARITLFIHDRHGRMETVDHALLQALLEATPLITHHEDGSRTLVFDMVPTDRPPLLRQPSGPDDSLETLRICGAALGQIARALGLPLTAALAESAQLVAEGEIRSQMGLPRH